MKKEKILFAIDLDGTLLSNSVTNKTHLALNGSPGISAVFAMSPFLALICGVIITPFSY